MHLMISLVLVCLVIVNAEVEYCLTLRLVVSTPRLVIDRCTVELVIEDNRHWHLVGKDSKDPLARLLREEITSMLGRATSKSEFERAPCVHMHRYIRVHTWQVPPGT